MSDDRLGEIREHILLEKDQFWESDAEELIAEIHSLRESWHIVAAIEELQTHTVMKYADGSYGVVVGHGMFESCGPTLLAALEQAVAAKREREAKCDT